MAWQSACKSYFVVEKSYRFAFPPDILAKAEWLWIDSSLVT